MSSWLRRTRGAVGLGLAWALGWAVVGGAVMEGIVDPYGRILDMWPQTLAVPGFVGGAVFSVLLSITEGRRSFGELSMRRFGAWGAVAGLLLGGLAVAAGAGSGLSLALRAVAIVAPVTAMSVLSASGSLALARLATKRKSLPAVR
ncbi:MAG: hypothetical protein AB7R55_05135 [Gemmatimonadales bacterium]